MINVDPNIKLAVLKEFNIVLRAKYPDKKTTLTVGIVIECINEASYNVQKAAELKKAKS